MIVTRLLKHISDPKNPPKNYEDLIPVFSPQESISRHIYQTDKSHNVAPALAENISKIKALNPDWTYHLFDDNDIESFILENYGSHILAYYKRIGKGYGAAKADFFRYLVIYRHGGVYLDIKSTITKPLSEVIRANDRYLLSYWNNLPGQGHDGYGHYPGLPDYIERGEIIQWYIAASAGHPLLRKVILTMLYNIDHYNPYVDGVGWTGTVVTTGPVMYTKVIWDALNNDPKLYPVRWLDIIEDAGFKYSIFESNQGTNPGNPNHTSFLSSDYRKNETPLITHNSCLVQTINVKYLKFLCKTH